MQQFSDHLIVIRHESKHSPESFTTQVLTLELKKAVSLRSACHSVLDESDTDHLVTQSLVQLSEIALVHVRFQLGLIVLSVYIIQYNVTI